MKWRAAVGLVASLILILSSGAHAILGWKALSAQLAATTAPADLVRGLRIGWQFGGFAMLAFGIIAATIFLRRLRGEAASTLPTIVIGVCYVLFGAWALFVSRDPFFLIMLVPGALLLVASR
jgi:TRAP-type C4-dicarboxylate transport system permease small subunit